MISIIMIKGWTINMGSKKGVGITVVILIAITIASFMVWLGSPTDTEMTIVITDFDNHDAGITERHKIISNSIEEADIMLKASVESKKCVQVGQWQRSGGQYKEAMNYLWSGNIGKVRLVKVWAYMGWYGWVDNFKDTKTPKGVDYNMWLGPAPLRKFNKNRFKEH